MTNDPDFERLVRDALSNLYDPFALETHAINAFFPKPASYPGRRAEHLRQVLVEAIESLRPQETETKTGSVAWRSYLALKGRYIDGMSLPELQSLLCLSERQLRRENSRAISALVTILRDKATFESDYPGASEEKNILPSEEAPAFQVNLESLDLAQVITGVIAILEPRLQSEQVNVVINVPQDLPNVFSDRIILRQVLLKLLGITILEENQGEVHLEAFAEANGVKVILKFSAAGAFSLPEHIAKEDWYLLNYWIDQLNSTLTCQTVEQTNGQAIELQLNLPQKAQPVLLVADDHEAAIHLIRRYLQGTEYRVIGAPEPSQVLTQAQKLRPHAVLLDVMMPTMDGWEILQSLKADPATAHIPVLICSVWHEPDLAFSLGATDYIKKPFSQQDLLQALARLNLTDT